ncbi:MAG TPA: ribonuclease Z [Bacillota bacterium]|nr:ribonuclease Z [Bacillota bacterium]
MELIFLGTGAGIPSKERNVSSIALSLLQEANSIWLFDCGEATQHQILHTTIKPKKINKIFITHLHGDHIFGLPGLLSSRSFQGGDDTITVYGPKGIQTFLDTTLKTSHTSLNYPLKIVEVEEGQIIDEDNFAVFCKKLDHNVTSYGYRIVEKDRPGKLLVDKLKAIGIPPGPIYQEIKNNPVVQTPEGTTIFREQFVGPDKKGKVISILGDTRSAYKYKHFVQNSDVLVHEATFSSESEQLAHDYFHSTTTQAAELAKAGNVKQLILTHISSRYQQEDALQLLHEARTIFANTELAKDFYRLPIK